MIRSTSTTAAVNNKASQARNAESSLQSAEQLQEQNNNLNETTAAAGFPSLKKGFDLSQIPSKPNLQTGLSVQCCAKDGKPCSCPSCKAKAQAEQNENDDDLPIGNMPGSPVMQSEPPSTEEESPLTSAMPVEGMESGTEPLTSEQPQATAESESAAEQESEQPAPTAATPALIVDDSVETSEGQMTKTAFLQELRSSICGSIEPVLSTAGQTTEGCPYLNYWLDLYGGKTATEVEATVKKYAPDSARAVMATEYISMVTQRALRAAEEWAATGRISSIPEGVPTTLPGQPNANAGNNRSVSRLFRKAKAGAPSQQQNNANDIRQELGEGQPLEPGVRARMESAFNMSFSDVRTHTDSNASDISSRINSRAFAVGNHVAFGSGEYKPGTLVGDALIAHELAHTIQQKGASRSVNKMSVENGYDALEQDADRTAVSVMSSLYGNARNSMNNVIANAVPSLRSGLRIQSCRSTPTCANPGNERSVDLQPVFFKDSPTDAAPTGTSWTRRFNASLPIWAKLGVTFTQQSAVTLEDATNKTAGGTNDELATIAGLRTGAGIEVFVVDNDIAHLGGAATIMRGDDTSQTILSDRGTSDTLLAHELGHILGIGHPPDDADANTIMEGTGSHSVANSTRNTMGNYNKITWPSAGAATCLNPDT